jgi:hypothetical protein
MVAPELALMRAQRDTAFCFLQKVCAAHRQQPDFGDLRLLSPQVARNIHRGESGSAELQVQQTVYWLVSMNLDIRQSPRIARNT